MLLYSHPCRGRIFLSASRDSNGHRQRISATRVPDANVEASEVSKKDMDSSGLFESMLGQSVMNFHEPIL